MNKWNILGIDKTKDKQEIQAAYRSKLFSVNPEDDAEGFMMLRKAYEEALEEADSDTDEEISAKGRPEDGLFREMINLYRDFNRRIDVEEWEKLFARDEFVSLDTADDSMHALLSFLMNYSFIPHKVYHLITDVFHIKEIKGKLVEKYPEDFIEFLLNHAMYRDSINYELFETAGGDIDKFIETYFRLDEAFGKGDIEEERKYIEAIEEFESYHPYVEICRLRHELHRINAAVSSQEERLEKYSKELCSIQSRAEAVLEQYKDDVFLMMICGDFAFVREAYSDAGKYYEMAQAAEPDAYAVKSRMGNIFCAIGEYEKAKDIYLELLKRNRYDEGVYAGMMKANNGLIGQLEKEITEKPDDKSLKLKLAWCHYRNNAFKEAIEVLETFEPSADNICEYHDLLGRSFLYIHEYEKALRSFFIWKNETEKVSKQDESEKSMKIKSRYGYVTYFIADCYTKMKNYDEARKYLELSISREHGLIQSAYELMCQLEYACENYAACVSACEKLLERDKSYNAYIYMAKSFDKLGQYSLALNACEHAIGVYPYYSEPYVLELEIYWDYDQFEDMGDVIARFDTVGERSDRIDIYRAKLLAHDEDYADSNELLLALVNKKGSSDTDLEDYFDVFTLLGSNYEDMEDDEQALHYYTEALKEDPENRALIRRIAGIFHVMGEFQSAYEYYDRLLTLAEEERYRTWAYAGKAAALSCMNRFEEAKKVYESCEEEFGFDGDYVLDHAELLVRMDNLAGCAELMETCIRELGDSSLVQYCIGNMCCFYGNEGYIEDAYRYFKLALERNEKDYLIYRSMGLIYLEHGMYEKAEKMFSKGLEIDVENKSSICGPYLLAIGKRDDITKPEYRKYVDTATAQFENADTSYGYEKKAQFYRSIKKYDEALQYIDMAINEKRGIMSCFIESPFAWSEKGDIYADMGEYEKAVECYERALDIFGHNALYEECIRQYQEAQQGALKK